MNDRLQDIADECHHRYSEHHIDLEKFAELIIKECVGIVETESSQGTDHTMDQILSHFGVKL